MKKTILFFLTAMFYFFISFSQVAINSTGNLPDGSAMLDISATDKGVLIPRVTLNDVTTADPISSPATGLIIFNESGSAPIGLYYWDGNRWHLLVSNNDFWGAGSTNHIAYWSDNKTLTYDYGQLYWDTANNRLGIGTSSPPVALSVFSNSYKVAHFETSYSASWVNGIDIYAPNLGSGQTLNLMIGKSHSTKNCGWIGYKYNSNSADDNILTFGHYGSDFLLNIKGNGYVGIGTQNPREQLEITKNFRMPATTTTSGIIYQDNHLFIHNYGTNNTFVGEDAGNLSLSGNDNTVMGFEACENLTSGSDNTVVGYRAAEDITSGVRNSCFGYKAGNSITSGDHNIAIGYYAFKNATTAERSVAIGSYALQDVTVQDYNVAVGYGALEDVTTEYNTAVGYQAAANTSSGHRITAIGYRVLYDNNSGEQNTAIGFDAGLNNRTGSYNVFVGNDAGLMNDEGSNNVFIGMHAAYYNDASSNVAVGYSAGMYNEIGIENVFVGMHAGDGTSTIDYSQRNTFVGAWTDQNGEYHNSTALGYNTKVTASNQVRIGNSSVTSIGGYRNWSNISDKRFKTNIKDNVPGLNFILLLRPVTYNLDYEKLDNFTNRKYVDTLHRTNEVFTGLVAQEVEISAKSIGYDFSGIDKPKNPNDIYGLRYAEFVPNLIVAIQELNIKLNEITVEKQQLEQQNEILTQEKELLKQQNEMLYQLLNKQ